MYLWLSSRAILVTVTDCVFSLQFMARVRNMRAMSWRGKNKVPKLTVWPNKMRLVRYFIKSLGNLIQLESTPWSQVVHTLEYRRLNEPIPAHLVVEGYDKIQCNLYQKLLFFFFGKNKVSFDLCPMKMHWKQIFVGRCMLRSELLFVSTNFGIWE